VLNIPGFSSLLAQMSGPQLALWSGYASIISLGLVFINTLKLAKISRFIRKDRDRIADTIKPFDIYTNIRDITELLERNEHRLLLCEAERTQLTQILQGLGANAECLRSYFRDSYGLRILQDNIYLDAGKIFEQRENLQIALEFYEKGFHRASAIPDLVDAKACLHGMYFCYALRKDYGGMDLVEALAAQMELSLQPRGTSLRRVVPQTLIILASKAKSSLGRMSRKR
jgi:hypothetical protein